MKLFKFLAVASTVSAENRPELDDTFLNQCQAAYLESQGYTVDPSMVIQDDCDKEDERGAYGLVTKWTNMWDPEQNRYIVPYYFPEGYEDLVFGSHTGAMSIEGINENVAHFERLTCVKLKQITEAEKDDYDSVVRVNWDVTTRACSSGVGRWSGDNGITMRPDCYTWNSGTTVNHEFMHRLGFLHEHQRADRDSWISIHANVASNGNYGKLSFGQWEDLGSPYDFNSILHYYSGIESDGLPTIGLASDPSIRAPVSRTWPMSPEDQFQMNAYHGCEMNNKCADAGEDRCGGSRHTCINQPIGYTCECAEGYDLVTDDEGVQSCFGTEPVEIVHDMVVMIDGTGSYGYYRSDACTGVQDAIRELQELGRNTTDETFRLGISLYSDRVFADYEFTSSSPLFFDVAMPLEDVSGFTEDDITDVYNHCMTRLGNMWYGGDLPEDVLGGLVWTRSADAMNWAEDSAKTIIVATDVNYWTKESWTGYQGSRTPPTSVPDGGSLNDLFIYGTDSTQAGGIYTYYPEEATVNFLTCSDYALDKIFFSVKNAAYYAADYDRLSSHACADVMETAPAAGSIAQQFTDIVDNLEDFASAAATAAAAVDECALGSDDCHADATCTDTTSSYTCACNAGFTGDGFTCTVVDACETLVCDGPQEFCHNGACTCNDGYEMVDGSCADVNECDIIAASVTLVTIGDTSLVPCADGASCHNTVGSYECVCDGEGWEEIDGQCVDLHAWKQVQTQYTIRMHKINGHLDRLNDQLEKTRFTRKYMNKMLKRIGELDSHTNEGKYRCDGSDEPEEEAEDLQVFDGMTNCKLASQINSALVSASRKWACTRAGFGNAAADRLVRHFNKLHRQFKTRMCSAE